MWPARSLLGLIALCGCSSAPVVDGPCTTNQQCVPEQRCISGVCTSVIEHGCKADADCTPRQYCDVADRSCKARDVLSGCSDDSGCAPTERCELATRSCVARAPLSCTAGGCPPDRVCNAATGQCDPVTPMPLSCSSDAACHAPTSICTSGRCVAGCAEPGGAACPGVNVCDGNRCVLGCAQPGGLICPAGNFCEANRCLRGCTLPGGLSCGAGTACDTGTGRCVAVMGSCQSDAPCGPPARVCESNQCVPGCGQLGGLQCSGNTTCAADTGRCAAPACTALPETCNHLDDNCEGTVDEGFRAGVVIGSYAVLQGIAAGCDGFSERIGSICNSAVHRSCAQSGCTNSGFGPVENTDDVIVMTCVIGLAAVEVPYATLAQHHAPCDGFGERIGPNCNAAIHRYCAAQGKVSGFGPVEQGVDSAWVVCLEAPVATVVQTQYSVLVGHHGECDGSADDRRIGPGCNAAIHRFCTSQGYASGFGPIENSGDTAYVTCVRP